jgi:hypothetical protein
MAKNEVGPLPLTNYKGELKMDQVPKVKDKTIFLERKHKYKTS